MEEWYKSLFGDTNIRAVLAFQMWTWLSWGTATYYQLIEGKYWWFTAGAMVSPIQWIYGTGIWFGLW
jgi:hypothetical protein